MCRLANTLYNNILMMMLKFGNTKDSNNSLLKIRSIITVLQNYLIRFKLLYFVILYNVAMHTQLGLC